MMISCLDFIIVRSYSLRSKCVWEKCRSLLSIRGMCAPEEGETGSVPRGCPEGTTQSNACSADS